MCSTSGASSRNRRTSSIPQNQPHDAFDAGAVVPAAVENHDLAGGGETGHVALDAHLAFLAIARRRERHDPKYPRAHPLGDALHDPTLAGGVAALEDNQDLHALADDSLLDTDQLGLQERQFSLVFLAAQLRGAGAATWIGIVRRGVARGFLRLALIRPGAL